jgi:oxalate decarboxylase/phosphoglucose isomerase-like protein (cupin superfamily)
MKYFIFIIMFLSSSVLMAQSQNSDMSADKVILDNDKLKVIEHTSVPQGDVCGLGMHYHEPHLTVVLTDSKVIITSEGGESQEVEVESGTSLWFESETHSVINTGENPTKMLLIYPKE